MSLVMLLFFLSVASMALLVSFAKTDLDMDPDALKVGEKMIIFDLFG